MNIEDVTKTYFSQDKQFDPVNSESVFRIPVIVKSIYDLLISKVLTYND